MAITVCCAYKGQKRHIAFLANYPNRISLWNDVNENLIVISHSDYLNETGRYKKKNLNCLFGFLNRSEMAIILTHKKFSLGEYISDQYLALINLLQNVDGFMI